MKSDEQRMCFYVQRIFVISLIGHELVRTNLGIGLRVLIMFIKISEEIFVIWAFEMNDTVAASLLRCHLPSGAILLA